MWGSLLDTKVGRLVLAEFGDPERLARMGVERFRRFAAARDVIVARKVAQRFVAAAKAAVPLEGADAARQLLAADLALLEILQRHITDADAQLARLLPATPFDILTTTPGWRWSAPPATAPRSVTRRGGRQHGRSTGHQG